MSRIMFYQDSRLTAVKGEDHMLGSFLQLFDREMESETPEGEGLVYDWSTGFGTEVNLTGESNTLTPMNIVLNYIKANTPMD